MRFMKAWCSRVQQKTMCGVTQSNRDDYPRLHRLEWSQVPVIHTVRHTHTHTFIQSNLQLHSCYKFLISTCVAWESNSQPFVLLMQCSPTEPHRNTFVLYFIEMHASSESWINNISIDVWFGQYSGIWGCKKI